MTTIGKRRRYPTGGDSTAESDDENGDTSNSNTQLTSQQRMSSMNDFASHRLIFSERRQLAELKKLTASDEPSVSPSSLTSVIPQHQQRPTKVFRRNEHGETIAHVAARKGDLKRLLKALKDGANVNEEDNAGWTPLHEAVTKNQYKAARLLLKSGANANASGPEGQTPLMDAVLNNNIKIVVLLLNYSADPSVVDLSQLNELMIKALKGEFTASDLSNDDNDEDSQSPSSLVNSADEFEGEDKNLSESSSTSLFHTPSKPIESCQDTLVKSSSSTVENDLSRKNPYDFESDDEHNDLVELKAPSHSNDSLDLQIDEQSISDIEQNYRIPPLRIVLARTTLSHLSPPTNMDENCTMDSSSLPIIEENEKFLSTIVTSSELLEKIVTSVEEEEVDQNNLSLSNLLSNQSPSTEIIISTLMDNLLTQIQRNESLIDDEQERKKKEHNNNNDDDVKQTTRMLRSHARKKIVSTLENLHGNENRRVSNRRQLFEKKYSFDTNERPRRKKTMSERSSNSDDQPSENQSTKIFTLKSSIIERMSVNNEDTNPGSIVDEDSNSTNTNRQISSQTEISFLPPIKRRLRERNATIFVPSEPTEDNRSIETNNNTRDIPINGIKQFLQIRQQIEKRHEIMLQEFVLPKVPKDFGETLMAKKNYLLSPTSKSFSNVTPTSLGIRRLIPPSDLDAHLSDVFARQEDERYRMKLRHQVERDKLILSHEQEILRLYGNATRLSINQEIPFSYCLLLKDNEVYNNPSNDERSSTLINEEYSSTDGNKRVRTRWNGRSFLKWLDDSNMKYKRLSCEINQRQHLEANTLYSMQRMVWLKHIPKETSTSNRMNSLLSERYLPKVTINTNFWTHWQANAI